MVTGGQGASKSVELLDVRGGSICDLPDLPTDKKQHTQNGVHICGGNGGRNWNSCESFLAGSWEHTYNIHHGRYLHVSWKSPLGLHIMGGQWSPRTTSFIPNDALISPETSKEDAIGDHWTLARNSE